MRRLDMSRPPSGPFTLNKDSPLAQGLVAWWPMGGATGKGAAFDLVGKQHLAGTATGMTLDGSGSPAMSFVAASSQYISNASLLISAYPLSVTSWFRSTTLGNYSLACPASGDGAGSGRKEIILLTSGAVRAFDQDSAAGSASATTAVLTTAGAWTHAAAVFTSTASRTAYINGGSAVNNTSALANTSFLGETRIGVDSIAAFYMNGDIGETCFYNVAISADIVARQHDPSTRFELWYPLRSKKWFSSGAGGSTQPPRSMHTNRLRRAA